MHMRVQSCNIDGRLIQEATPQRISDGANEYSFTMSETIQVEICAGQFEIGEKKKTSQVKCQEDPNTYKGNREES